jgi:hypothetical protein
VTQSGPDREPLPAHVCVGVAGGALVLLGLSALLTLLTSMGRHLGAFLVLPCLVFSSAMVIESVRGLRGQPVASARRGYWAAAVLGALTLVLIVGLALIPLCFEPVVQSHARR